MCAESMDIAILRLVASSRDTSRELGRIDEWEGMDEGEEWGTYLLVTASVRYMPIGVV